jgi:hypothetical protein
VQGVPNKKTGVVGRKRGVLGPVLRKPLCRFVLPGGSVWQLTFWRSFAGQSSILQVRRLGTRGSLRDGVLIPASELVVEVVRRSGPPSWDSFFCSDMEGIL